MKPSIMLAEVGTVEGGWLRTWQHGVALALALVARPEARLEVPLLALLLLCVADKALGGVTVPLMNSVTTNTATSGAGGSCFYCHFV